MKKQILVLATSFFLMAGSAIAQGPQRMSVDERVKIALDKIEAGIKPSESVRSGAKVILIDFYTAQQKKMEEIFASGNRPDREEMMQIRKQMGDERDAKLKNIFSAEQFAKWQNEIEPSLRPQRDGGEKKEK
ncbi:MAG TPA: hypothetical protein PK504_09720 [Ferruginibacter sp.]|nr:hypothetical protein [Ferruginibacter sp.]HRE62656.1 hypothetical protein [Ferruginibacter sp.]